MEAFLIPFAIVFFIIIFGSWLAGCLWRLFIAGVVIALLYGAYRLLESILS